MLAGIAFGRRCVWQSADNTEHNFANREPVRHRRSAPMYNVHYSHIPGAV